MRGVFALSCGRKYILHHENMLRKIDHFGIAKSGGVNEVPMWTKLHGE